VQLQEEASMAYADFTLDALRISFGLTIQQGVLFPHLAPIPVPPWLQETLAKSMPLALGSEKARSEFIIAPILLALRDMNANRIAIYSGQRLDSDPARGLVGECDFVITTTPPLPIIQTPIISIVEAKKNDVESGLGQCAAQMLGALQVNQRDHSGIETIYGCVTTGETWQLLKLHDTVLMLDSERYYINELELILGALQAMLDEYLPRLTR
jgi:hypothetical protein